MHEKLKTFGRAPEKLFEKNFLQAFDLFIKHMVKEYKDLDPNAKSSEHTSNTMLKRWLEHSFHISFSLSSNQALHLPKGVSSFFSSRPNFCLIPHSREGTGMRLFRKFQTPPPVMTSKKNPVQTDW